MGRASLLLLLCSLLGWSGAAKPQEKARSRSKAAASKVAVTKAPARAGSKTVSESRRNVAASSKVRGSKGGRLVSTRLVRTKSGRLARVVVHTPPPPSYQTHPDPDRYIEIQKALVDRGYFKGEPNGEWGEDSVDAMRRFQAASNLPDDGKISALSLTGLGLGPRHDGSTASTVPLPSPSSASSPVTPAPSIIGSTVGPAASTPAPAPTVSVPTAPVHPPNL